MRRIVGSILLLGLVLAGFQPTNVPNGLGVGQAIRPYVDGLGVTANLIVQCDTLDANTLVINNFIIDTANINTVSTNKIILKTGTQYVTITPNEISLGSDTAYYGKLKIIDHRLTNLPFSASNGSTYLYNSNSLGAGIFGQPGSLILDAPRGYVGLYSKGSESAIFSSSGIEIHDKTIYLNGGFYQYNLRTDASNYFEIMNGNGSYLQINETGATFAGKLQVDDTSADSFKTAGGVGISKNLNVGGNISVSGDSEIASDKYQYWGDKTTEGSWRLGRDGDDFVIQRYESGTWITNSTITK